MKAYRDLIKESTLLSALSADEINTCLTQGRFNVCRYGKNNIIHFDGEQCSKLEIILTGNVVIERIDRSGNLMTITEFFNDDILGGNLLFSKNPYFPMTIKAKKPTVILEIRKEHLFELFSANKDFLRSYLAFVSDHAAILGDKIKHYVNKTIRESILSFLAYERKRQHSNHIRLDITKKALAEKIGVQRTSLCRELAKMKKEDLLDFDAKSITILDTKSISNILT